MIELFQREIEETHSQENFRRIQNSINGSPFSKLTAKFFEVTFGRTGATFPLTTTFVHNLGFQPADVIATSVIGGTVTWNYSLFNATTISVTVSAVTTVRFLLGRYEEETI